MLFFLAFGVAFGASYLITPLVGKLAISHGFLDRPSPIREAVLKPRLGGLSMYLAFLLALLVTWPLAEGRTPLEARKIWGIIVGATLVVVMGSWDDKRELGPLPQLGVQLLSAGIALASGVTIDKVTNPFGTSLEGSLILFPWYIVVAFTLFWVVGAMNTLNFLDGVDGLAAGVAGLAALVLAAHSLRMGQESIALLPLALAGSALGFLPHNFFPAKITMGTSGSVFLGFALGTLAIIGGTKAATLLLVLGIPIVDAAWIIVRRAISGRSPFVGDRTHLHHRLLEIGLSPPQIVLLMYGACGFLGAAALVLSSRTQKLYVLVGMVVAVMGVLALVAQGGLRRKD